MADCMYTRNRPDTLDGVVGQARAVAVLKGFKGKIPPAVMLVGPSGVGKTTIARILAADLGCPPGEQNLDFAEINCGAVESPLDVVRELRGQVQGSPFYSACRVWILDELQTWSRSKGAQEALLKILEDSPDYARFFLCTTDPQRVIKTIHTRCTRINLDAVKPPDLVRLLKTVCAAEKLQVESAVLDAIADAAGGSPRAAIVELERVAGLPPSDRLAAVSRQGAEKAAFDLVKALVPFRGQPRWQDVGRVLDALHEDGHDPESLRCMVLAACRTRLLKGGEDAPLCYKAIVCLSEPLYDRATGSALLAAACWKIVSGGGK